jgi:hypothetical protein
MIKIDFKLDDAQFEKLNGKITEFAVEVIQDINEAVVTETPFKTGFLRGSWYAGLNSAPDGAGQPDPSGAAAIARMNLTLADLKIGDVYNATNGANYAVFVEFGTQHMRPRAFVRGVIDRAQQFADAAAVRVSQS